jgi:hypothetical protein
VIGGKFPGDFCAGRRIQDGDTGAATLADVHGRILSYLLNSFRVVWDPNHLPELMFYHLLYL